MTAQTFIVPYLRTSPVHIPRRDLVLGATDNLALRVTIVESDVSTAQVLEITGGIGGPAVRLAVWRDSPRCWWDYGAPGSVAPEVLWTGTGTESNAIGSFEIAIPQATMSDWPPRCGFWLFLDWDGGLDSELLAQGALHVRMASGSPTVTATPITTDVDELITTD